MCQKGFYKVWCRAVSPESLHKYQGSWQDSQEWMSSVGNSPCGILTWTPSRHPDTWSYFGYSTDSSILYKPISQRDLFQNMTILLFPLCFISIWLRGFFPFAKKKKITVHLQVTTDKLWLTWKVEFSFHVSASISRKDKVKWSHIMSYMLHISPLIASP